MWAAIGDGDDTDNQMSNDVHCNDCGGPADRRRYRIGDIRAEVTDIEILETGDVLRTLSFEGDSLEDLVALRKELGVKNEPNLAVHQAIENEVSD